MSIEEITTSARISALTAVAQMAATALRDYTDDPAGDQALEEAIKNIRFRLGEEKHSHDQYDGQQIARFAAGDHILFTAVHKYEGDPKNGWLIDGAVHRCEDKPNEFKVTLRKNGALLLKGHVAGGRKNAQEMLLGAIKGMIGVIHNNSRDAKKESK